MGTFTVALEIRGPEHANYERVDALVDTRASYTMLPASKLRALGVTPHTQHPFLLANGQRVERQMGRAWVRVEGREEMTLVVFGDEGVVVLGAVTLEEMRFGVDPLARKLTDVPGLLMASSASSG
jgi:predicted aspartyl protease